jgi:hypothetical protein
MVGQQARLIVVSRSPRAVRNLLQTNQIGLLVVDHVDHPIESVSPVPPTDSLVNVVRQQSHGESVARSNRQENGGWKLMARLLQW